jgi:hypothetical protein
MTGVKDQTSMAVSDRLYEQYGRPLEAEHWGEFVAIAQDGRTLLGSSLWDLTDQAIEELGPGFVMFKVGEKAVGTWRR